MLPWQASQKDRLGRRLTMHLKEGIGKQKNILLLLDCDVSAGIIIVLK